MFGKLQRCCHVRDRDIKLLGVHHDSDGGTYKQAAYLGQIIDYDDRTTSKNQTLNNPTDPLVMNHFLQQPPRPSRSPSPGPSPVPPMKFQKTGILHSMTNQPIFAVSVQKSSLSGKKNNFTLHRHWNGQPLGSFRFSSMDPSKIEFDVNGAPNKFKEESMLTSSTWSFPPLSFPGKKWVWKRKSEKFTLTDDGMVQIATVVDGNLVVEPLGFGEMAVDEIVLSAYAMWQKRRRDKGDAEEADAVGEVLGAVLGG